MNNNMTTIELMHPFTTDLSINGYIQTILSLDEFYTLLYSLLVDIHFEYLSEDDDVFSGEFWEYNLAIVLCTCFSEYIFPIDNVSGSKFKSINQKNQESIDFLIHHKPNYIYAIDTDEHIYINNSTYNIEYYRFYTLFDEVDILYSNNKKYITYREYLNSNFDETSLGNLIKFLQSAQMKFLRIINTPNVCKVISYKKLLPV